MLRTRILTAVILAPAVLAAIFYLSSFWYGVVFALITAAGCLEWGQLCGIGTAARPLRSLVPYVLGYLLLCALLMAQPGLLPGIMAGALALWAVLAWRVFRFDPEAAQPGRFWVDALAGYLVVGAAFAALLQLRATGGPWLVVAALVLVWLADIGAYFAGRTFGRRKLAPRVSPGKSWEGAIGGTLVAVGVMGGLLSLRGGLPLLLMPLLVPVVALSIIGDLFESTLKRRAGVKDSGRLLPGHGGMLDRIDALLPALPLMGVLVSVYGSPWANP